jgi:hypothetical protein
MPTVDIRTEDLPEPRRRAIALSITRWMRNRGIEPSHVTVRFEPWPAGAVYSGGLPVDALLARRDPRDGPAAMSISCALDPERDDAFRQQLAEHLASTLGAGPGTALFYLEFRDVSPRRAFLLRDGVPRPANAPAPAAATPLTSTRPGRRHEHRAAS